MSAKLSVERLSLAEANAFVAEHHRHHKPVVGHLFSIGAAMGDKIVGVAIVGRPVARRRDDGVTAEITRLCTDGTRNACSFLYGACARAAFALGFKRRCSPTRQTANNVDDPVGGSNWRWLAVVLLVISVFVACPTLTEAGARHAPIASTMLAKSNQRVAASSDGHIAPPWWLSLSVVCAVGSTIFIVFVLVRRLWTRGRR